MKQETEVLLNEIEEEITELRTHIIYLSQSEELSEYINTMYAYIGKLQEEIFCIREELL